MRLGAPVSSAVLMSLFFGAGGAAAQDDGADPDPVREYVAWRASPGIALDGRLNEDAWHSAPWTEPFVDIRGGEYPKPEWETGAKLLWDERYLYVGAWLEEPHLWGTLTERDAIVYRDHDFEIFLDPDGHREAYYEFEVNVLGTMLDLFLDRPYRDGGSAFVPWDAEGLRWAVHAEGTVNDPSDVDSGWGVEFAIPWASLVPPADQARAPGAGEPPKDGDVWRVNFSRVQWPLVVEDGTYRKEREPVHWDDHPEDNWVWSPQGEIDMHAPERWGRVIFRAAPPPGSH